MADNDWLVVDHLLSGGRSGLTDGCGILVISVEQELPAHTAAEAAGDFPHFNVLHEAVVNELGLIYMCACACVCVSVCTYRANKHT